MNIFDTFKGNLKDILNINSCSTSFYSTAILPIVIVAYIMLIQYLINIKKLKKKQYKSLLFLVTAGIPIVTIVLNLIFKNLFDTKSCSSTIISTGSIGIIFIGVCFLIKTLVDKKQKKFIPLVVICLGLLIFGGNFTYNVKYQKSDKDKSDKDQIERLKLKQILDEKMELPIERMKSDSDFLIDYDVKSWKNRWAGRQYKKVTPDDVNATYDKMTKFNGSGYMEIEDGIMKLSGHQPRCYVGVDWQNAEMNVDYKRVGTIGKNYSGCTMGIRSNSNGHSRKKSDANNTHTYYVACRHDGYIEFLKERKHGYPTPEDGDRVILQKTEQHGMKSDEWYNIRFRCYNIGNNRTKLQCIIDGKIKAQCIDEGDLFQYNGRGVVFIRNTDIEEAQYKNFKAHEIDVSDMEDEDNTGVEVILREDQVNKNNPHDPNYPN